MPESYGMSAFFPYMMPSLATFLAGVVMVFFVARREIFREDVRIFAIISVLISLSLLPRIVSGIAADHGLSLEIPFFFSALPLFAIPLAGHLIHAARGRQGAPLPIVIIYIVMAVFTAVSLFSGEGMSRATGWCALGMAPLALLSALFPADPFRTGDGDKALSHLTAVISGAVLLLIMIVTDIFLDVAFDPLSFAFIPLLVFAAVLFGHPENLSSPMPIRVELISALIITLGLMPIMTDIIFITSSASFLNIGSSLKQTGFLTASTVSLVICTGIALVCNRRANGRIEVILISAAAMLSAILNLRDIMGVMLHEELTRIILINDVFLVMFIGVMVHLAVRASGTSRGMEVSFFYGVSFLFIGLMLFRAAAGQEGVPSAPARGMEHFLFLAAVIFALIRSMWIIRAEKAAIADALTRKKMSLLLYGYALACIVLAASIAVALYNPYYSVDFLVFIPVSLCAWGVFSRDLLHINASMKRQIFSNVLRGTLILVYCVAVLLLYYLLNRYSIDFIVSRVIPYGIPPLLSFISAAFLSLFVIGLEKNRTVTLPFSIICFCYAVLNLDILLVGILPDAATALIISRIDHFFLVMLLLGSNFHLVFLVTEKKDQWWKVYAAYGIGFAMAPFAFSTWYFQGMYTYYWGFFARKAVLYDVMSALWMSALLYVIYLLFTSFRREGSLQRRNIRNAIISFTLIAVMSMANTPAIYGYEVYPLGTFIFVALFFLAYSLFKFNLDMAMQYVRSLLFWSGLGALLLGIGLAPMMVYHNGKIALSAGIFLVAVLYTPLRNGLDAGLNLFIRKASDILDDRYKEFTANLSHVHHLSELHVMVRSWIFKVFDAVTCTSVFLSGDDGSYAGWTSFNDRISSGLFGRPDHSRDDVPVTLEENDFLIQLCTGEKGLLTRDMLTRMPGSDHSMEWSNGLLKDVEIILPVSTHERTVAVFLIGTKADGSRYSSHEIEIITSIMLFLGPHIENAKLLGNLEQKVDVRTRDLNQALVEAMIKEREIVERNQVIERQNQISAVLLETSTRIYTFDGLDDLFGFTLAQLKSLFPDLRGGIILEGSGRNLLEASAFVGLSEAEQKIILDNRNSIDESDFSAILREKMGGAMDGDTGFRPECWKVFPLQGRGEKTAGYMILNGKDLDGPSGETVHLFIAQISSVVQNRLLLTFLERMASTDGLTGVYNRSFLDRELDKSIKHARRFRNMWFSLMIVDVNGLKQINDTYGHSAGDKVIVKAAELLKSACRETDIVARIGGDEFAVLMPSTNRVQAEILLARIRTGEKNLIVVISPSGSVHINIPIRISIGLASSDEDEPDLVMKVADDLMYADKQRFYAEQAKAMVRA